ncbi:hypothetical protein CWB41_04630 [Methylovirgula ligni]|uniref:HD/PDEase domain-containing protein n=1 Tax=Methylovirgula ligni TaxID=569860 RepID=A0A3D9Z7T3_9HYPH|nr:HD domain-containing protein [Methylovirgula ligni]QAY95100.1 hypothetical protein CWB41_04630 [Methylovirgula ligni]REF89619.1 hypothetical protein DES32_0846 [Methylovirgula ligni]
MMKEEERVRCPIHDLINFKRSRDEDILLWKLVQTSAIQRLRRIKQLGFSEFVYPGASHTRFSHVLGAMHMARRMLDVFAKNEAMEISADLPINRKATLAAALLHDVGHGPFSHVFEEISDHFGVGRDHESYTLDIIDSPEIKEILTEYGVYEKTRQFFAKEPGYSVFNAVISSQMDCDRLDFLCRDRYHTGIRSAAIDLEWLFDSLRIEQVPVDDEGHVHQYSFVLAEKGLAVAEEFVIAYMQMYHTVYFHKATRGIQFLVHDMLVALLGESETIPQMRATTLSNFIHNGGELATYMQLDDSSILALAHMAAENNWGHGTTLARRFLNRDSYKCFEIPSTVSGNVPRSKLERFRTALQTENIYFIEDIISHRSYKQHAVTDPNFLKNILIKKDGEIESLGNVSGFLRAPAPRVARIYFANSGARDRARVVYQGLG